MSCKGPAVPPERAQDSLRQCVPALLSCRHGAARGAQARSARNAGNTRNAGWAGQAPLERALVLIAQHAQALRIHYLLDQSYLEGALEVTHDA